MSPRRSSSDTPTDEAPMTPAITPQGLRDPQPSLGSPDFSHRPALARLLGDDGLIVARPADEAELIARREAEWNSSLRPADAFEVWIVRQIAVESVALDRRHA